ETLFSQFETSRFPGATLYRKRDFPIDTARAAPIADNIVPVPAPELPPSVSLVEASPELCCTPDSPSFSLLARTLADQGNLAEPLLSSEKWTGSDRLDASGHYLRAVILQELGDLDQARGSLRRAIYLSPDLPLAHFALGNLARATGNGGEAAKHYANTARLL